MTRKHIASLFAASVLGATGAVTAQQAGKALAPQTKANLDTALHGEAFAHAKYMLYARAARDEGHPEIARLFQETARTELHEHFAEQAKLAGLAGPTSENLRDAIKGETYESEMMYRGFAEQARAAGDTAAADRFEELARDENRHRQEFQKALDQLEQRPVRGGT